MLIKLLFSKKHTASYNISLDIREEESISLLSNNLRKDASALILKYISSVSKLKAAVIYIL
jgi:hypothetical protein